MFSRGVAPNAGYKTGPGEINLGVSCGGVSVGAGDIVVGDRDGVVAVPLAQCPAVATQLALVKRKEADAEKKLAARRSSEFWDASALRGACGTSTRRDRTPPDARPTASAGHGFPRPCWRRCGS